MQYITDKHKKLGKIIKELRLKKNKSLNIFAFENDIQKGLLSKLENGEVDFKFSTLLRVSKALEIEPSELLKYL